MIQRNILFWLTTAPEKRPAIGGYRPDIDGLRALAVLVVVAFHYSPSHFQGGFIGVDIFFVISGYLITGLLAKAVDNNKFSLVHFYHRRIRRIFPVLILVLTCCLVAAWFLFFFFEYKSLGEHVAASAAYVQNFLLWSESGYFDNSAIQKPLLHLWSLAVEEQFYIFWPIILWLTLRRRHPPLVVITIIGFLSFGLNVWHVLSGDTNSAFYLPVSRVWELMMGSWLAIAHRRGMPWLHRWPSLQSCLGVFLILVGLDLISKHSAFPGFWALLPVLGAAFVINAGPAALPNRYLFSLRPVVWVGLISYTLYVWHWPLWSITHTVMGGVGEHTRHLLKLGCLIISFLMAWITYRWVELPIRGRASKKDPIILAACVGLLGIAGLFVYFQNGLPDRTLSAVVYNEQTAGYLSSLERGGHSRNRCSTSRDEWGCVLGDKDATKWIIVSGDSHSQRQIPNFDRYGKDNGIKVYYAGAGSCLPFLDTRTKYFGEERGERHCYETVMRVARLARNSTVKPSALVLVDFWSSKPAHIDAHTESGETLTGIAAFKYGLKSTLSYYESLHIPVLLVEDNPHQKGIHPVVKLRFNKLVTPKMLNESAVTITENKRGQATVNHIIESLVSCNRNYCYN